MDGVILALHIAEKVAQTLPTHKHLGQPQAACTMRRYADTHCVSCAPERGERVSSSASDEAVAAFLCRLPVRLQHARGDRSEVLKLSAKLDDAVQAFHIQSSVYSNRQLTYFSKTRVALFMRADDAERRDAVLFRRTDRAVGQGAEVLCALDRMAILFRLYGRDEIVLEEQYIGILVLWRPVRASYQESICSGDGTVVMNSETWTIKILSRTVLFPDNNWVSFRSPEQGAKWKIIDVTEHSASSSPVEKLYLLGILLIQWINLSGTLLSQQSIYEGTGAASNVLTPVFADVESQGMQEDASTSGWPHLGNRGVSIWVAAVHGPESEASQYVDNKQHPGHHGRPRISRHPALATRECAAECCPAQGGPAMPAHRSIRPDSPR
ncbi:hypothetical protein A0H81_10904 [Grifola frondosa]|uniref:Uncharacterized protein n=1 Tax=Grifola frondosa TaxID=5627 RepID=A0A1C7LYJ1_GRIFR|nr:hypothetical protein A0H81_10904 [Grifola frondosa]